jgi:hypothetical protein
MKTTEFERVERLAGAPNGKHGAVGLICRGWCASAHFRQFQDDAQRLMTASLLLPFMQARRSDWAEQQLVGAFDVRGIHDRHLRGSAARRRAADLAECCGRLRALTFGLALQLLGIELLAAIKRWSKRLFHASILGAPSAWCRICCRRTTTWETH